MAILLVVFHHSGIDPSPTGVFSPILKRIEEIGWIGVDCFFVLSGFLIGGLLFAEIRKSGSLDAKRFLIRRAFKIWPQYVAYLFFFFIIGVFCFGRAIWSQLRMMGFAFVHLQNYSRRWESHIWSLAVEEHFYLLLPVIILLALAFRPQPSRTNIPYFVAGTMGVMIIVLAGRIILLRYPFRTQLHYFGTHGRLDSLALGVLIAYISVFHSKLWGRLLEWKVGLTLLGIGFLLPIVLFAPSVTNSFTRSLGFTMLACGFACLLVAALGVRAETHLGRLLEGRTAGFVAWIRMNSYGIYLWHQDVAINPIPKWLLPRLATAPGIVHLGCMVLMIFGLSLAVSYLSTQLIERPALAWRDRVFPSRSRSI